MRKRRKCRDDWYAKDRQLGCGRIYTPKGRAIFDSQVKPIVRSNTCMRFSCLSMPRDRAVDAIVRTPDLTEQ